MNLNEQGAGAAARMEIPSRLFNLWNNPNGQISSMRNSCSVNKSLPEEPPFAYSAGYDLNPLVLIAGKEPNTLLLYKTILELWKYRVSGTEEFEELVGTIQAISPDLILIDSTVSFTADMENLCLIRNEDIFDDIPVIITSGHAQTAYQCTALTNGADAYLLKPINFELLENSLKKLFPPMEQ